jgi:hypothetical protein
MNTDYKDERSIRVVKYKLHTRVNIQLHNILIVSVPAGRKPEWYLSKQSTLLGNNLPHINE